MSGNFSFPPPPPPPPKAASGSNFQPNSQSRGRSVGRGRSDSDNFRGRGGSNFRGNHQNQGGRYDSNPPQQSGWQSGIRQGTGNDPNHVFPYGQQSNQQPQSTPFQPGTYVNPSFGASNAKHNQRSNKPNGPNAHGAPQHRKEVPNSNAGSPQRTVAGHKRKLDALKGPPKEKKPPPQTAPAVPSFGAPILPQKPSDSSRASTNGQNNQPKSKPASKGLGLVPSMNGPQYYSSDSEDDDRDIDEEAMYAELGNKLTFEHNGVVMSLNSQADLVAWKKERLKNWPTQARMAEKAEERRRIGEERKRLLAGANVLRRREQKKPKSRSKHDQKSASKAGDPGRSQKADGASPNATTKPESEFEKAKRALIEQTQRLDELRRRVTESEARNREAKAQLPQDNTSTGADEKSTKDAAKGETAAQPELTQPDATEDVQSSVDEDTDDDTSSLSSSSVVSSDSSSEADSSDEAPEQETSRPSALPAYDGQPAVCRYFAASGYCRDGGSCPFRHEQLHSNPVDDVQGPREQQRMLPRGRADRPPKIESVIEKKSIFQRLVEQEQSEGDKLALQVIKYLGKTGFFEESGFTDDG